MEQSLGHATPFAKDAKAPVNLASAGLAAASLIDQSALDPLTHARLWRNPCGFAARFNYIALRYNRPLYGWVEKVYGLSRPEYVVLYSLGLLEGVTASDISSSSGFPRNTLSRAVNKLLKIGLIERVADATDGRAQRLFLAPGGRAILEDTLPRFVATEADLLAPLSLVERETLSMLMAKVALTLFEAGEDNDEMSATGARRGLED